MVARVDDVAAAHLRRNGHGTMTLTLRVTDERVTVAVGDESAVVELA